MRLERGSPALLPQGLTAEFAGKKARNPTLGGIGPVFRLAP